VKNRRKWHSILLVGLVLLLVSSVIGCSSGYTQEDVNTAWQEGYTQGFSDGVAQCEQNDNGSVVIPPLDGNDGEDNELPAGAIWWYEAKDHIGDRLTVCGPVVDSNWASGSSGKPTFLNIGEPYPDPDRFTVVIWIDYRSNFPQSPEDYYLGKNICVTGLIIEYDGSTEIEVQSPDDIQEY
jgi:hypothetical protein